MSIEENSPNLVRIGSRYAAEFMRQTSEGFFGTMARIIAGMRRGGRHLTRHPLHVSSQNTVSIGFCHFWAGTAHRLQDELKMCVQPRFTKEQNIKLQKNNEPNPLYETWCKVVESVPENVMVAAQLSAWRRWYYEPALDALAKINRSMSEEPLQAALFIRMWNSNPRNAEAHASSYSDLREAYLDPEGYDNAGRLERIESFFG